MLAISSLSLITSGCEKDLYDPNSGNGKPIISGIPDNFDWKTTSNVDLSVNVNDQYNGKYYYTVEIFDKNPVISSDAKLLIKGIAKENEPFKANLYIQQTINSLAIRQTDPTGISIVAMSEIVNNNVNCNLKSTKTSKAERTLSKAITKSIIFNNDYFPTNIPAGAINFGTEKPISGKSYIIPNGYNGAIDLEQSTNINLYAVGSSHISRLYLTSGSKLFIMPDANVITDNNDLGQTNVIISINTGASFNTQALEPSSNIQVLNKGTINSPIVKMTNSTVLYNTGTINAQTKLSGENGSSQIENEGTINAGNFELAGDSKMNNYGNVTIDNFSHISSTGAVWRHLAGIFKTKNMDFQANNRNNINACQLIVTNLLQVYSALLRTEAGAYTSCKSLYIDNARIEIGNKGILTVSDIATYNYNAPSNGIYGVGNDYALYKVKKVVATSINQANIIYYGGKVQIECQDHPSEDIDPWNKRYRYDSTIQWVPTGGTSISIDKSECSLGNNPKNGTDPTDPVFPIEVKVGAYTYAMEDSWPYYGDYDMNDLVLKSEYSYKIDKNNKVLSMTINATLRAIGAFNSIGAAFQLDKTPSSNIKNVSYGNNQLDGSVFLLNSSNIENDQTLAVIPLFDNAHKFITRNQSTGGQLINTVINGAKQPEKEITATITFNEGTTSATDIDIKNLNFFIVTDKRATNRTEIHLIGYNETDKVNKALFNTGVDASNTKQKYKSKDNLTWGLMIPGDFRYPIELESIINAYNDFKSWAISSGTTNTDWYKKPIEENIYK